jgi:hypothetical protein
LLTTVIVSAAIALMVFSTVLALVVRYLVRRRRADDLAWAEATAHRLSSPGNRFQTHNATRVRGSIAGRTAVLARSPSGKNVAVVTLHVPFAHAEGPRRPNLRLPRDGRDHRFGTRWVQVWTDDGTVASTPALLARALTLAQAAEDQQTAPWALFAGQQGLAFRASRQGEPCVIEGELGGVPVHVHLDGAQKPPLRTVIVAAFPRPIRGRLKPGPLASMGAGLPELLERYDHAEIEEGMVRLHFDGMVIDDLEKHLNEAIQLARAFASSALG